VAAGTNGTSAGGWGELGYQDDLADYRREAWGGGDCLAKTEAWPGVACRSTVGRVGRVDASCERKGHNIYILANAVSVGPRTHARILVLVDVQDWPDMQPGLASKVVLARDKLENIREMREGG
jgi:hypothetical protein